MHTQQINRLRLYIEHEGSSELFDCGFIPLRPKQLVAEAFSNHKLMGGLQLRLQQLLGNGHCAVDVVLVSALDQDPRSRCADREPMDVFLDSDRFELLQCSVEGYPPRRCTATFNLHRSLWHETHTLLRDVCIWITLGNLMVG